MSCYALVSVTCLSNGSTVLRAEFRDQSGKSHHREIAARYHLVVKTYQWLVLKFQDITQTD
ncbi:hypothetical protein GMOD_00008405 [Pyrenophora seminiperda CCB06]|uniref:Uncharacterized protein n=1 Tax=Pyrenophora seminiperda CCB06 TaxID=1302712 RepID=A0A3M7M8C3_9PLEO|nr:hypothetical protein GMOD_00008405 [Pyrenophora seminiperda CCB06]